MALSRRDILAELVSKFVRVLENGETSTSSSSSKLQCTKVPKRLRSEEKGSTGDDHGCYDPKLISLGPYHHGKTHFAMGEKLKLKLAEAYRKSTNQSASLLVS